MKEEKRIDQVQVERTICHLVTISRQDFWPVEGLSETISLVGKMLREMPSNSSLMSGHWITHFPNSSQEGKFHEPGSNEVCKTVNTGQNFFLYWTMIQRGQWLLIFYPLRKVQIHFFWNLTHWLHFQNISLYFPTWWPRTVSLEHVTVTWFFSKLQGSHKLPWTLLPGESWGFRY